MNQTQLARAAGLAPATITRAKRRGTRDLASIDALAAAAGLQLNLAPLEQPRQAMAETTANRSPLADPKWGLAWSNSAVDPRVLIRNAITKGGLLLLVEAVKAHGIQEVLTQWATVRAEMTPHAQAETQRQLRNIQKGIALARNDSLAEMRPPPRNR